MPVGAGDAEDAATSSKFFGANLIKIWANLVGIGRNLGKIKARFGGKIEAKFGQKW